MKIYILLLSCLLLSFVNLTTGQVSATQIFTFPTAAAAGQPFDLLAVVNFTGSATTFPTCRFNFSSPVTVGATLIPGCPVLGGAVSFFTCNITAFNLSVITLQGPFTVLTGPVTVVGGCTASTLVTSFDCDSVGGAIRTGSTTINPAADLQATLTDDATVSTSGNTTGQRVVDFNNNQTTYTIQGTMNNIGACAASGVSCVLVIPDVVNPANPSQGVVEIVNTTLDAECSRVGSTISCNYGAVAIGGNRVINVFMNVRNNGNLTTSMQCNATNLVDAARASDSLFAVSVNIPPPHASSFFESSSSDVIVNVVIPLSVFGGVMCCLLTAIGLTIAIFLIIKKVKSEESVGF